MRDYLKFYINGAWVDPVAPRTLEVINPANEEAYCRISIGSKADVDNAVKAARAAFPKWAKLDPTERAKITGVLSIFSFVSVMITFKAIVWWRTQHPGPVLSIRNSDGVQRMDPAMESMMYQNWIPLLMIAFVFVMIRWRQEETQREIEAVRRFAHAR